MTVDGVTLSFNGPFTAPVTQVFHTINGGKVVFLPGVQNEAHPEWWHQPETGDYLPALEAAAGSGAAEIVLLAADYPISATWKVNVPYLSIRGAASGAQPPGRTSRLIVRGASSDVMQIGPDIAPAPVGGSVSNALTRGIHVSNLSLARTTEAFGLPVGLEAASPAGLRIKYVLGAEVSHTYSVENNLGYFVEGAVDTVLRNNWAFRGIPNPSSSNDFFIGFFLDGEAEVGLAGGNASLYLLDHNLVTAGFSFPSSIGALARGAFVDTTLDRFETSNLADGIVVSGSYRNPMPVGAALTRYKGQNADLHIINPIIDTFTHTGISILDVNEFGMIDVRGGYAAAGVAAGAIAAYYVNNMHGNLTLVANQALGWFNADAGGTATGEYVAMSSGVHSNGNIFNGFSQPVRLQRVANSEFADSIRNVEGRHTASCAVTSSALTHSIVRPIVTGSLAILDAGVCFTDADSSQNEIDVTMIDAAALAVPADKIVFNNNSIRSRAFGIGNVVTGVFP